MTDIMLERIKIINLVFDKFYMFLIFIYFLMILGVYTKHYFKLPNFEYGTLLILFLPGIYNWIIYSLENRDLKQIQDNEKLNEHEKRMESSKIDAKYMTSKYIILLRFLLIASVSFISGYLIYKNNPQSMVKFIYILLCGFFMSFNIGYTFIYEADNRKRAKNFIQARGVLTIIAIIPIIFYFISNDIINAFTDMSNYDYSMFALTFALLCATLSVLSFTYAMTIEDEENTKKAMKQSGEHFFISTIFCLIFLSCLFILSLIWDSVNITSLTNVNILNLYNFLIANSSVLIILSFFVSFIYSMKYLIKGIILSLKNLNFEYELI